MIINENSIVHHVIQYKNGIIKHVNVNVQIIISVKKVIVGVLAHVFFENRKYLKSVADTSVAKCDEIVIVKNNLSTKKANTIATNFMSTASINCHSKKVTDYYILHTVLLATILLLIISIICYHYAKNIKWKILNLEKFVLKIVSVIISMT